MPLDSIITQVSHPCDSLPPVRHTCPTVPTSHSRAWNLGEYVISVKAIVDSRQFASFVGQNEDAWFDAKHKNPYDFNRANDRFELAVDVNVGVRVARGYQTINRTVVYADFKYGGEGGIRTHGRG